MLKQISNMRKYDGVNHDVNVYSNSEDYSMNRAGQYFLLNKAAKPSEVIRQSKPLSVHSQLVPANSFADSMFLPEVFGTQIEKLPNQWDYDIIIVSSRYADVARQTQMGNLWDLDYLDRLYVPIPIYYENPQYASGINSKIGSVGFRKVWYPRTPQEYVTELYAGRFPSAASMQICLEVYKTHRMYWDCNTANWLNELERCLTMRAQNIQ